MEQLFFQVLNMSPAASLTGCAVALLRLLFKKRLPRRWFLLLWCLVLFRALVPVALPAPWSAFNAVKAVPAAGTSTQLQFVGNPGPTIPFPALQLPQGMDGAPPLEPGVALTPIPLGRILASIWLCGFCLLLAYGLVSYLYTLLKLRKARLLPQNPMLEKIFDRAGLSPKRVRLYESGWFAAPVVCGLVRPRLVLTPQTTPEDLRYVVAHELTHIRRRDNLWKCLATLALYLHWFNPLFWLFYRWYTIDMETACDEAAIRRFEMDPKAYAYSLVNMAAKGRSAFAGGFLSFGECALKERVQAMLRVKRYTVFVTIAGLAVVAGLAAVFLTNPQVSSTPSHSQEEAVPSAQARQAVETSYSILGSLRERDIAQMRVRTDGAPGDGVELPSDAYSPVVDALQSLGLQWQEGLLQEDPIFLDILRKDGACLTLSLGEDTLRLEGTLPQLAGEAFPICLAQVEDLTGQLRQALADATSPAPSLEEPISLSVSSQPEQVAATQPAEEPLRMAAELAPLREENPPWLRLPYGEVAELNLIDRDLHICYPVDDPEDRAQVLSALNSLTVEEGLPASADARNLRLLQVRLTDGSKYDFWCYDQLLVMADSPVADGEALEVLYGLLDRLEQDALQQGKTLAEWLGYMNPYRITRLSAIRCQAGEPAEEGNWRSIASQEQHDGILETAGLLKSLWVNPDSALILDQEEPLPQPVRYQVDLEFENGVERYTLFLLEGNWLQIHVESIPYYDLAYQAMDEGAIQQLETLLEEAIAS